MMFFYVKQELQKNEVVVNLSTRKKYRSKYSKARGWRSLLNIQNDTCILDYILKVKLKAINLNFLAKLSIWMSGLTILQKNLTKILYWPTPLLPRKLSSTRWLLMKLFNFIRLHRYRCDLFIYSNIIFIWVFVWPNKRAPTMALETWTSGSINEIFVFQIFNIDCILSDTKLTFVYKLKDKNDASVWNF